MSYSTELSIEIGLDSHHGCRDSRDYIMGQIATIERSRLRALDIETVTEPSVEHN